MDIRLQMFGGFTILLSHSLRKKAGSKPRIAGKDQPKKILDKMQAIKKGKREKIKIKTEPFLTKNL